MRIRVSSRIKETRTKLKMEYTEGSKIERSGRTLLVALKLAPKSRELLTSIIAKLTKPGDHVVGVHVLNYFPATDSRETKFRPSTKQQLASTFQAVLGVYQGLCSIKKIELDIKILTGSRLRKVLVEAAKEEKATKLILGSSEYHGIRSKNSVAKYCSERLPETCSVLIVDRGKVIFEKNGTQNCSEKRRIHLFGASRSMAYHSNRLRHSFEMKLPSQSFSSSENLLKTMWSSKRETAKLDACVLQGSKDNSLSKEKALPISPVSMLSEKNSSHCKGNNLQEVNPCLQPVKLPKEPMIEAQKHCKNKYAPGFSEPTGHCEEKMDDHGAKSRLKQESCHSVLRSSQGECLSINGPAIFPEHPGKNQISLHSCQQIDGCLEDHDQFCPSHQNLAKELQSISLGRTCKNFNYEELKQATSNFSPRNMIGKGGCSNVYQGTLPDGRRIAVKCLNQSTDTEEELLTEVEILTTFCHQHIVPLLGYCVGYQKHLLVYEFASNGSLEDYLHGEVEKPVLEWAERFKIAEGTAQALYYLHNGCPQSVVHRDLKSSNILLTSNFKPQVSDFGLAKLVQTSTTNITCTDIFGTFGYIAPEYFMFGKINDKTDVYSFGVVLLEIITGRPAVGNSKLKSYDNLVLWARPLLEAHKLDKLIDPRLKGQFDVKQMNQVLLAASLCIRQSPRSRPHMDWVVKLLSGEEDTMVFELDDDDNDFIDSNGSIKESSDDQTNKYSTASESCEVRKYMSLAMLGVDDDAASQCSMELTSIDLAQSNENIMEFLNGRFSRSSSIDSV